MTRFVSRLADPEDQVPLVELWERCGLTRPWNEATQDFEFAFSGPASAVIVLESDGVLCGGGLVGHDGHRGAVYYVGVDPDLRREGAGRALMKAMEDWLRTRGVWKLNLLVRKDNPDALGFYERLGYLDQNCISLGKRLDGVPDRNPE